MRASTTDPVDRVRQVADRVLPPDAAHTRALQGRWLGHPLHPALTDLPIGFWTSAWVLDLVGGEEGRRAAQLLVGLGVISVVPTAWSGWADWTRRSRPDQRLGLVHAGSVAAASTAYAASWVARRRGSHGAGVVLGHVGAGLATLGGYLGGHLAFSPSDDRDPTRADEPRDQEDTTMTDPDDRTNEPAVPADARGEDAERTVDGDARPEPAPLDADRDVDTGDDDEPISDPGGDSDPDPAGY